MTALVTASMLYDLVSCPHRVTMDLFADPAARDEPNALVELLWERGTLYEEELIEDLEAPIIDLSPYAWDEKEQRTTEAMERGEPLIYSGRIQIDDLLGDPDLLRREEDGYIAGDIKSGRGSAGGDDDEFKPKKIYGVQLDLYTDILERNGLSPGRRALVWDVHGEEVTYDFKAPYGQRNPRTIWQDYREALAQAQSIVARQAETLPAYCGECKLCHWYSACLQRLSEANDLTLIPDLGRSKRESLFKHVGSIEELAEINIGNFIQGKKMVFSGIGPGTLEKLQARANLISAGTAAKPYLREPIALPHSETELFFDIEVDPMRDLCYLHGFVERRGGDNSTERYVAFFTAAASEDEE